MGESEEDINEAFISHIIEELSFEDTMVILNYLENNSNDDFEILLKNYFDTKILNHKNIHGILLQDKDDRKVVVKSEVNGNVQWTLAEPEDIRDLIHEINGVVNNFIPAEEKLNKVVGFMSHFKMSSFNVFKIKDMTKKRRKAQGVINPEKPKL